MTLVHIDIEQFRCIEKAQVELAPDTNLIVGANASGKTSFLEAIYLLGSGHSFRTRQTEKLIRHQAESFLAVARVNGPCGTDILGVRGAPDSKEVRINGEAALGLGDLAARLPVQVIDPEVHRLLEDGPVRRRRFMDWGVFHVEQRFHDAWRRYQRALRQRNVSLRSRQPITVLRAWDQELVQHGTHVTLFRECYVEELRPFVDRLGQELLGLNVNVELQRGWKQQTDLETAINDVTVRDQTRGSTSVGPHRADLMLTVSNLAAKDRISRGQQKMLACVLLLAQQAHRSAIGAPPACLLLDDPAAELDVDNLGKLLSAVAAIPTQLVVTALSRETLKYFQHARLFHVEHGAIKPVA
jgi:DNA replication and repair protein RecF